MANKRRPLELFEVYAGSRQREGETGREREFVKPGPGMTTETPTECRAGVQVPEPCFVPPMPSRGPDTLARAVAWDSGYLTVRARYWVVGVAMAVLALALVGVYRLGHDMAGTGLAVAEGHAQPVPIPTKSPRFEGLQVAGGSKVVRPTPVRTEVMRRSAAVAPKPSRDKRHHLIVAIYQLGDQQRAKRALQAFRNAGFSDLVMDTAGGYRRLVSPYFASVSGPDAKNYQAKILRVGKRLNDQYKLGSKNHFRDCYWETVK